MVWYGMVWYGMVWYGRGGRWMLLVKMFCAPWKGVVPVTLAQSTGRQTSGKKITQHERFTVKSKMTMDIWSELAGLFINTSSFWLLSSTRIYPFIIMKYLEWKRSSRVNSGALKRTLWSLAQRTLLWQDLNKFELMPSGPPSRLKNWGLDSQLKQHEC